MDINKLIKDAHEMAVKKGFYDCTTCNGTGNDPRDKNYLCYSCQGEKIDQHANIPEKLMLIVSELGEAQEALRRNRFADWNRFNIAINDKDFDNTYGKENSFALIIKDTFEDEIADVYIRLADLCGYLEIIPQNYSVHLIAFKDYDNISSMLLEINRQIHRYYEQEIFTCRLWAGFTFAMLTHFCQYLDIDIDKHITAKMAYNATRPYKHGKEF
jgi:NTP pyrophosphatase (non-canonical NTP hydrolase)